MMEYFEYISGLTWLVIIVIIMATIYRIIQLKRQNKTGVSDAKYIGSGKMIYYAKDRHGLKDREYQFLYKKVNGSWRAYIIKMPNLKGRNPSGVITHRMFDGNKSYVCWDRPVATLKDMQTISKVWADNIQEYIATGRKFG